MGGMSGSAMSRYTPIDWRDFGRIRIQGLIGGPIKPCSDCHIDLALEKFGLCKKCWDNACRKLKICAVCYEPTLSHLDFPPDVIPYEKGSGEWVKKKLDNWKKTYCSEKCRGVAKSKRNREKNPEKKLISNRNFLLKKYPLEGSKKADDAKIFCSDSDRYIKIIDCYHSKSSQACQTCQFKPSK